MYTVLAFTPFTVYLSWCIHTFCYMYKVELCFKFNKFIGNCTSKNVYRWQAMHCITWYVHTCMWLVNDWLITIWSELDYLNCMLFRIEKFYPMYMYIKDNLEYLLAVAAEFQMPWNHLLPLIILENEILKHNIVVGIKQRNIHNIIYFLINQNVERVHTHIYIWDCVNHTRFPFRLSVYRKLKF